MNLANWYRKNTMTMARQTNTPIEFYLNMTVPELNDWISEHNNQIEEIGRNRR